MSSNYKDNFIFSLSNKDKNQQQRMVKLMIMSFTIVKYITNVKLYYFYIILSELSMFYSKQ